MNRTEFMNRLEKLLDGIPQVEKEEALKFYNDYFDEAGPENEQRVIAHLVSPENIANSIRSEFGFSQKESYEEFQSFVDGSDGMSNGGYQSGSTTGDRYRSGSFDGYKEYEPAKEKKHGIGATIGMIFLTICALPILLPIAIVVMVFMLVAVILMVVMAVVLVVVGVVLIVMNIVAFVSGIAALALTPFAGLCVLGKSLMGVGAGILAIMLTVFLIRIGLPTISRFFSEKCDEISRRVRSRR